MLKRNRKLIVHRQAVVNNLTNGKPMIKGNIWKLPAVTPHVVPTPAPLPDPTPP